MSRSRGIGLILCNVIWSSTYAICKLLFARGYQPMEIAFLRYLVAAIPAVIYCAIAIEHKGRRATDRQQSVLRAWLGDLNALDLRLVIVGALTFFVSPLSQLTGLKHSRAIDGSIMIAIEPLVTVLAACVMLGEKFRPILAMALSLAVVGACLVSGVTPATFVAIGHGPGAALGETRLFGNAIFSISMLSEAAYSAISKPVLTDRRSPILFVTVALSVGLLLTLAYDLALDGPGRLAGLVPLFQRGEWIEWALFLFLGLLGTLGGYLYWMLVLKDAPLSIMALTLYVQPVLGLFWGHVLADEPVTSVTLIGAALIGIAVWIGVGLKSR